tara:strand:- start:1741 stop:2034 length:294 start_codon:yes stop_codon:yes gene_type:complete
MPLKNVLKKINQTNPADVPVDDRQEVTREIVIIRGLLNELLENPELDEARRQEQFSQRLMELVVQKDSALTQKYVLEIMDKVCKEENVSIKLKTKLK